MSSASPEKRSTERPANANTSNSNIGSHPEPENHARHNTQEHVKVNGVARANGSTGHDSKKDAESQQKQPRSRVAAAIQTFSPIWFAMVMDTGLLGIIMHENPQPYNGFWWSICSYILFITTLVLFVTFSFIFLLRTILYPETMPGPGRKVSITARTAAVSACIPISIMSILGQTINIASDANWNGTGHNFMLFCYVTWCVTVVWILFITQATFVKLMHMKNASPDTLAAAIIIPGVGVVTSGVVGAIIVTYGYDVSVDLAVPIIIIGYILVGWGVCWTILIYAAFFIRLLNAGMPAPGEVHTLVFMLGPPGQTASALVALGMAAEKYLPQYIDDSSIFTVMGGQSFKAISLLFALSSLGVYALWLIFAIYSILETAFSGKIKSFSLTWWGTIFPTATGNLAFALLAEGYNSQAFAILSCIWLVVLFIDYFVCWILTLKGIWSGKFLDGREKDEKEARQKAD